MLRSFSSLSFSNTLCLTCFWGLVAIEIIVAKIYAKMNLKNENADTAISLTTISTSFFWVGFVLDNVVCFTLVKSSSSSSEFLLAICRSLRHLYPLNLDLVRELHMGKCNILDVWTIVSNCSGNWHDVDEQEIV